jgi:hypothetical protein
MVSTLYTFIKYDVWNPSQSHKAKERNEGYINKKEEVKLYLFADSLILLLELAVGKSLISIKSVEGL